MFLQQNSPIQISTNSIQNFGTELIFFPLLCVKLENRFIHVVNSILERKINRVLLKLSTMSNHKWTNLKNIYQMRFEVFFQSLVEFMSYKLCSTSSLTLFCFTGSCRRDGNWISSTPLIIYVRTIVIHMPRKNKGHKSNFTLFKCLKLTCTDGYIALLIWPAYYRLFLFLVTDQTKFDPDRWGLLTHDYSGLVDRTWLHL